MLNLIQIPRHDGELFYNKIGNHVENEHLEVQTTDLQGMIDLGHLNDTLHMLRDMDVTIKNFQLEITVPHNFEQLKQFLSQYIAYESILVATFPSKITSTTLLTTEQLILEPSEIIQILQSFEAYAEIDEVIMPGASTSYFLSLDPDHQKKLLFRADSTLTDPFFVSQWIQMLQKFIKVSLKFNALEMSDPFFKLTPRQKYATLFEKVLRDSVWSTSFKGLFEQNFERFHGNNASGGSENSIIAPSASQPSRIISQSCRQQEGSRYQNLMASTSSSESTAIERKRPIVIDGCNVCLYRRHQSAPLQFNCQNLVYVMDRLRTYGCSEFTIIFPEVIPQRFRPFAFEDILTDLEMYIERAPRREIGDTMIQNYDDHFMVDYAAQTNGVVVSNDRFRDLLEIASRNSNARTVNMIRNNVLNFKIINECVIFPIDPLGKVAQQNGLDLHKFLSI